MTRTISILLVLLRLCPATAAGASVLRGARPLHRQLLGNHVQYSQNNILGSNNDAMIESGEKAEEKLDQKQHRFLQKDGEETTVLIPTFALDQTIDTSQSSSSFAFASKQKADDVIRSLAENHLAVIYADSFQTVGAPSKVLLTVVTNNDDEREDATGIFIRKSFIGGVATFPGSSTALSEKELEQVTLDAFTVPGLGQSFLDALKEDNHPDLEGLLLINSRKIQQGGPVATSPAPPVDSSSSTEEKSNPMNSVWAIAAVVALGAMFITIIMCTSILYCDYRKRKQRMEQRRSTSANNRERRKKKQNESPRRPSPSTNVVDPFEIVVPAASGETEDQTPSPSSQGSDAMVGNVVGKGSVRGGLFKSRPSRRTVTAKSKAASTQLKDSTPIAKHDYVPQSPPSEDYSVGEDTTMLYPSVNRQRSPSKDGNMSDFDGYSMDGMSHIDGGVSTIGNDSKSLANRSNNRDTMYAGDATRDFESIWDDEQSRLTSDGISVDGPTKEAYGDLSKPLNELIENQDAENQSSAASVDLNEFDSGSESGSNIGKFTLELLGQGSKSRKSGEQDEEDSILGKMYDDTSDSDKDAASAGDSVDSTPSWAAPIQSAINNATKQVSDIFRTSSAADDDSSRASSTNDKFMSSLPRSDTDDNSVKSGSSRGSSASRAKATGSYALGTINSSADAEDEHPDAMIDNINTMLSECRVILDKDNRD